MTVHYFTRKPRRGNYSIERIFSDVVPALPAPLKGVIIEMPVESSGIWNRLKMMLWSAGRQGDINHITGDIHFVDLLMKSQKTILTIHDCGFVEKAGGVKRWLLKKLWMEWPVSKAALITTVSESSKREIVELTRCDADQVKVVHNYVSDRFSPGESKIRSEKFRILQIGTKPNKNLDRLVSAIKGLDIQLVVIGILSTEQKDLLVRQGINYENHTDLDEDQLVDVYRSVDLLASVSLEEGFGLPILEAQKTGIPVLTSNVSAMPEVAGEGAKLVSPVDEGEIRKAIRELMSNGSLREHLIEKGFRNANKFTLERTVQGYVQVYRQLKQMNN